MLIGWLLKNIPTSLYANIFYLVPPAVMVAEYIYYGENISQTKILGTIVILLGIFVGFSKLKLPQKLSVRDRA